VNDYIGVLQLLLLHKQKKQKKIVQKLFNIIQNHYYLFVILKSPFLQVLFKLQKIDTDISHEEKERMHFVDDGK
jgi:5-carboxymethyl-2-hydroxymuconate isomerase